jgi:hypothetical protein
VIARIEELMKHEVAGDPCTGLKWTRRTTKKIAGELCTLGIEVKSRTVARILKKLRFSLRVNRKMIGRGSALNRNEQFKYIARVQERFAKQNLPIVSIDSKKKEMVGNFKNGGTAWDRTPVLVNDHDFLSDAIGIALPNGLYDLRANRGTISVGISHDTPDFAVDNLVRWWSTEGRRRYPDARELLVLADGGGSNGPRNRAFKYGLQTRLCNVHNVAVTLCHYPAGASKWNPIEHRLFSEISKNWKGRPLDSYETILNYIRTTRTATGLRVRARLIRKRYPTGVKISDAQMKTIDLRLHEIQPVRNYTLHPTT